MRLLAVRPPGCMVMNCSTQGHGALRTGQRSAEPIGAGADQPPGEAPRGLALLLDDLIDDEGAARLHPPPAVRAHGVASRKGDADPPLPFGAADEELLGRDRLGEEQGDKGG
jgi:hypothetical protein